MLFNSYSFIFFFLPAVLVGYFQLARRSEPLPLIFLLVASLVFYGWWDVRFVPLLLASTAFNYAIGRRLVPTAPGLSERGRHWLLAAGIAVNVLVLGYFKYAGFALENWNRLTGGHAVIGDVVLPLGISFFTFTQIAFLVDASRGQVDRLTPVGYALFVTYFPHLIAGPILHHREMMPQFASVAARRARAENFAVGLTIFALGLFKKTVLADGVARFVPPIFDPARWDFVTEPTLVAAWAGALAYTLQIYFDFSAYCDMAVGMSWLLGIRLPINFLAPYRATSIVDFWRRWHMTLSRFLRGYLYIPLGGNRKGPARRYANLLATMLLGGLWHGASWTFVVWGGLHGLYLCVNHGWRAVAPRRARGAAGRWSAVAGWTLTFLAVTVAWVFFRAPTLAVAFGVLRGMAGLNGFMLPHQWISKLGPVGAGLVDAGVRFGDVRGFIGGLEIQWILGLLAIALLAPTVMELVRDTGAVIWDRSVDAAPVWLSGLRWGHGLGWAVAAAALGAAGTLGLHGVTEFLYFRF